MTDWMSVERDPMGDWVTAEGARCPDVVGHLNREYPYVEWWRAAEFCQAVADALQAEAEAEEFERDIDLRMALTRLCHTAEKQSDFIGEVIRTVREHDA